MVSKQFGFVFGKSNARYGIKWIIDAIELQLVLVGRIGSFPSIGTLKPQTWLVDMNPY